MFQFAGLPSTPYVFSAGYLRYYQQVGFPIRKSPDQQLVQQLPEAYRSHPRPSSAPGAKASTVCPCSLDLTNTFRKHHLPLWSFQGTRGRRPAKREVPGEAHCHEGGAAGDPRRVRTPGPGLSKLNSKAPSRAHTRVSVAGRQYRRGVDVISRRAHSTRRSRSKAERSRTVMSECASRDGLPEDRDPPHP